MTGQKRKSEDVERRQAGTENHAIANAKGKSEGLRRRQAGAENHAIANAKGKSEGLRRWQAREENHARENAKGKSEGLRRWQAGAKPLPTVALILALKGRQRVLLGMGEEGFEDGRGRFRERQMVTTG